MLMHNRVRPHRQCPRWWSLAAAGSLLGLAVFVSGVSLRAQGTQAAGQAGSGQAAGGQATGGQAANAKAAPGNERGQAARPQAQPNQPGPGSLPGGQLGEQIQQESERMHEMMRRAGGPGFHPQFGFGFNQEHRLGVNVRKPSEALAEQLDLPKNEGLVIEHVMPNSPAAKAGLKPNDILLQFNGKQISNNPMDLTKALQDVKADKPVEAVVLRKGKHETIKDISLPEVKAAAPHPGFQPFQGFPQHAMPQPGLPGFPGGNAAGQPFPRFGPGVGSGAMPNYGAFMPGGMRGGMQEVMMTTIRTADHFTSRYQEGSLIITVTGHIADGKDKVGQIHIQDGGETKNYESASAVPEQYRDKVQAVIEASEPGKTRLEIKTPSGAHQEKGK